MNRIANKSSAPCLIDFFIEPEPMIEPRNKVLSVKTTANGFRFEFRDKQIPAWWFEAAFQFGFAVQDNDPGQRLNGRLVSLVDDKNRSKRSWHSDPDNSLNSETHNAR